MAIPLGRPSAFAPLVMSGLALATVAGHAATSGVAPQADEGTAAHIWQLLMAGQIPIIAVFAMRWLRSEPKRGAQILALQACAAVAALLPVWWFHW